MLAAISLLTSTRSNAKAKLACTTRTFDPKLFKSFELRLRDRSGARNGILR